MIKFTLVLESKAEDGSLGDRTLEKEMEWPIVPRIGEQFNLEGNSASVANVDHDFPRGKIFVYAHVDDLEFDSLVGLAGYVQS